MLLSIGMIVKNEEKYLRDCLKALTPILNSIESELIIHDTGSTDSTVDIAKEFTNKVFHIEWKNDFAWARNHGLRKAHGKWFMYVDADEIFEDTRDIIEFFKSNKYKRFNSASYKLLNPELSESTVFSPVRLYRIKKGICFRGKIHESMGHQLPVKHLSSKVLHYGYKQNTLEQKRAKTERNLTPLLEELESTPNDPRLYWHIVNEYLNIGDYYEAARQNERGIAIAKPNSVFFDGLYVQQMKIFQKQQDPERVIKAASNYFNKAENVQHVAIELRLMEANAYVGLKRYDEAIVAFKQAHDLFLQNRVGKLSDEFGSILPIETSYLEDESHSIKGLLNVYVVLGDFDTAWKWVQSHQEILSSIKKGALYVLYATQALMEKRYSDIANLYKYAIDNYPAGSEDFIEVVATIEKTLATKEAKVAIMEAVASIANISDPVHNDDYAMFARLRIMYKNENLELKSALDHFLLQEGQMNQIYAEVIVYAIYTDNDFSKFLDNLHITNTDNLCKAFDMVENADIILLEYMENMLPQDCSMKLLRLMGYIANYFLAIVSVEKTSDDKEEKEVREDIKIRFFEITARLNHRRLKQVYKEEAYCENSTVLHEREEFFYYAGTAYEKWDSGDHLGFVRNMRHVVKISEQVRDIAKLILQKLQEENRPPEPEPPKSLQDQLKDEISNLKDIIYASIKAGDKEKASLLIRSYEAINPKDPDIPTIKTMIESWIQK